VTRGNKSTADGDHIVARRGKDSRLRPDQEDLPAVSALLEDFKKFINKGNIVELAVGLIIALKIKDVIDSMVKDIIMPVVGAIFGKPSFDDLHFKLGDGVVTYGLFINALLNFLIVAAALFAIVKVYESFKKKEDPAADVSEKDVLVEIRDLLAAQSRA